VLDVALDALLHVTYSIGLLLVGAFLGWTLGGSSGALIGALVGLALGLWLDISDSKEAQMLKFPVSMIAVGTLLFALFR
jgi:hypothetical protein